jgi:hypothetical protein
MDHHTQHITGLTTISSTGLIAVCTAKYTSIGVSMKKIKGLKKV